MAVSQYMEDPSSEVNVDLSNTKRKYQTSNIIVQDPQKEGILSFLKENFSQGKMTEVLKNYVDQINVVTNNPLKLPKLKKSQPKEAPKLKLPKLQKI